MKAFHDVLLACLASDSSDDGLMNVFSIQEFSDFLSRFISVHKRHIAIHQNEIILTSSLILLDVLLHFLDCLLAVKAVITNILCINSKSIFKNNNNRFDVELLVIHDQNSLLDVL